MDENKNIFNNLNCPNCKLDLEKEGNSLLCLSCSKKYNIINGVPDFRDEDEYWCNVSREKMRELNSLARKSNNWQEVAKKIIPEYSGHFIPFNRADSQFLWPTDENSIILDAGSMWGGISIPVAQYHKEVYAVDKTVETLEFLDIRAKQMNLNNIHTVASSIDKMPFPDNFFDLVVLSGVLEWVGLQDDIILEKQWQKTGRGLKLFSQKKYKKSPTEMQIETLKEINRVLKPDGKLFLAIENRFGYMYLLGWPEEHINLPFVGILPRFLANFITKLLLKTEFRTYVYGINGYKKILKESGFTKENFFGVFHHYINPTEIIPLELVSSLKNKIFSSKRWLIKFVGGFIPSFMMSYLSPSIIAFASKKQDSKYEPRIKKMFIEAGIIKGDEPHFNSVKWTGRSNNDLPVNYLVYTDNSKTPSYFCKIARDKNSIEAVKTEAENLKKIQNFLKGSNIEDNIPQFIYYGNIGGVTFLVTKYLKGYPIKHSIWSNLKSNKNFQFINKYATKRWLNEIDYPVKKALSFINDLEKLSIKDKSEISVDIRQKMNISSSEKVPLSLEHGDYDLCNILTKGNNINIIDFEHLDEGKTPFLDLGNLLFNYVIFQWKDLDSKLPLEKFANEYGWTKKIREWVNYYSNISGLSMDILRHLPALAVLEQNSREYPKYRDPYSYPMYGEEMIKQMIQWKL